jgi:hypothetical protein
MSQIQQLIAERYQGLDDQIEIDNPFYLVTNSGACVNCAQLGMSDGNLIYAQNVWQKCPCGKEEYQLPNLGMLELVRIMPLQCLHLSTYMNQMKDYILRIMVFNGKTKKTMYFKYAGTEPDQKVIENNSLNE